MSKLVKLSDLQFASLERRGFDFRGRVVSDDSNANSVAVASTPEEMRVMAERLLTQASEREAAQAEADRVRAVREAAEAERVAIKQGKLMRLDYHIALGKATAAMLDSMRSSVQGTVAIVPDAQFLQFQPELTPLAESYGFSIVVVGDRTSATLVQIPPQA